MRAPSNINRTEIKRSGLGFSTMTAAKQFEAFDELSPRIREFLNGAPIRMCADQILRIQRKHEISEQRIIAELERSVQKWRTSDMRDFFAGEGVWKIGGDA